MLVQVHQVVLSLAGTVLVDDLVGHLFTISNGLIQAMDIWTPSSVDAAIGS